MTERFDGVRPTEPLPAEANLQGCAYRVSEHEGLIVFSEIEHVWSCKSVIPFSYRCGLWFVDAADVPVSHIAAAYEFIKKHRWGSHGRLPDGSYCVEVNRTA